MSTITIASAELPYYGSQTPATVRVFASRRFFDSGGELIPKGSRSRPDTHQELSCSKVGNTIVLAQGTLYSTYDSSVPSVTYSVYVYDTNGVLIPNLSPLFPKIRIPATPTSTTWEDILAASNPPSPASNYYTNTQTDALLATKQAALVSGTNIKTINGQSLLGSGNVSISDGGGSVDTLANAYGNDLAAAITAIGSTPTTLIVDAATSVSTFLVAPDTLVLEQRNDAKITTTSTGQIVFNGLGIADAMTQKPFFAVSDLVTVEVRNTNVNTTTNVITTSTAHGFTTGQQLRYWVHPSYTNAIGGLGHSKVYYAIVLTSTTLKLATTYEHALASTAIDLTTTGGSYAYLAVLPVAWNGTVSPQEVSSELIDTGNTSLTDRLERLTGAFGNQSVTFHCFPERYISSMCMLADGHRVHFLNGHHRNNFDVAASFFIPFYLGENGTATAESWAAIIHESSVYGRNTLIQTRNGVTNAHIIGCHFSGEDGSIFNGSDATVAITNASNCSIRGNWFDGCHAYHVGVIEQGYTLDGGGITGSNNYSCESVIIDGNLMTNYVTQVLFVIAGKKIKLTNNIIDVDGFDDFVANCSLIDIEPNTQFDNIEDLEIAYNTIYCRDTTSYCRGIELQSIYTNGITNTSIHDNKIFYSDSTLAPVGIAVDHGNSDVKVFNNQVTGGPFAALTAGGGRRVDIRNNDFAGMRVITGSLADSIIADNQVGTLTESEQFQLIFSDGSGVVTFDYGPGTPEGGAWQWMVGLKVFFNEIEYVIASVIGNETNVFQRQITTTPTFPLSIITQLIGTAGVDTVNNEFTSPSNHKLVSGDILVCAPDTGTTLPTATPGLQSQNYFYVIKTANNKFKLATTHALALAATCDVDITSVGVGTNLYVPAWFQRFNSVRYSGNTATTMTLAPAGYSQIRTTGQDGVITNIADAAHTADLNDHIILYTSLTSGRTVTLPTAVGLQGKEYIIKDGCGGAAAHNITVDGAGTETINGASTYVISADYGSVRIKSTGAAWVSI